LKEATRLVSQKKNLRVQRESEMITGAIKAYEEFERKMTDGTTMNNNSVYYPKGHEY